VVPPVITAVFPPSSGISCPFRWCRRFRGELRVLYYPVNNTAGVNDSRGTATTLLGLNRARRGHWPTSFSHSSRHVSAV